MKVLVLGGYGVFGSRVARLLLQDGFEVIVAGRSKASAEAFVAANGGRALVLDKDDLASVAEALANVHVVIDAIGPFQGYETTALAKCAIEQGCHYLDLSDDAALTANIGALDALAKEAGVVVLSGVSSVPALSSAVVENLRTGIAELALIDMAILPGNRAPRGRSVMGAILSQVGRPLRQWRGGQWTVAPAWSGAVHRGLPHGLNRAASLIGAPDLELFPKVFDARSVIFRAGLELPVMHHGLRFFGWLHRLGLLPRLDRLTTPMLLAAEALAPFGSDQGGMSVRVAGRDAAGQPITRAWRLHMTEGQGPFVPAIPSLLVLRRIRDGDIPPGAKPAINCFLLSDAEAALNQISGSFDAVTEPATPLFEQVIGAAHWASMPESYRVTHDLWDRHEMRGVSSVTRGTGFLVRLIAAVFRFPRQSAETPLRVTMERIGQEEHWTRDFDGQRFKSVLSLAGPQSVYERFGPFTFKLSLPIKDNRMKMEVERGWLMGLPLPKALLPRSETSEYEQDGVFHFDVRLSAPLAGLIVHYKGWLARDEE